MTDPQHLPSPPQQKGATPSAVAQDIENIKPKQAQPSTKIVPMTLDPQTELATQSVVPAYVPQEEAIPEIPMVGEINGKPPQKAHQLDALQPENLVQTENGPAAIMPTIPTAHSGKIPTLANTTSDRFTMIINRLDLKHPLPKIVALGLTIQSLVTMYRSIKLILFEIPQLEAQLQLGAVPQATVNIVASNAAVTAFSTVLGLFFAVKLTFMQTKTAKSLSILIGSMVFIGNAVIQQYLTQFDLPHQFSEYSLVVIEYLQLLMPK